MTKKEFNKMMKDYKKVIESLQNEIGKAVSEGKDWTKLVEQRELTENKMVEAYNKYIKEVK